MDACGASSEDWDRLGTSGWRLRGEGKRVEVDGEMDYGICDEGFFLIMEYLTWSHGRMWKG